MSSRSLRPSRRKVVASALAATLGLAGLGMAATPAGAVEPTDSTRVEGVDRYETAAAIADATFDTATDVVLARGDVYADALAGNGLAGVLDAPILLTESDELTDDAAQAIAALGAENVWIMGGTAAIAQSVEDTLDDDYTVVRVEGQTRIGTAIDAATNMLELGATFQVDGQTTAILVNGYNFPDAISASPAAYALGLPVLLTEGDDLNDQTAAAIEAGGVERVIIVGGTSAVSQGVEDEVATLVDTVSRYAGGNRYTTAVDFADEFLKDELGWDGPNYSVATGEKFADALSGGPHAGMNEAPILLTPTASVVDEVAAYLATNCAIYDVQFVYGGIAAVTEAVAAAHAEAAQCDTNQSFAIAPATPAVVDASTVAAPNQGARTFTVSGLGATPVNIALFPCTSVAVADGGSVTFVPTGTAPNQVASGIGNTGGSATIEVVQGVSTSGQQIGDDENPITPTNGTVTFTVDATGFDCYVPVVYVDADNDNQLDVDANGQPEEAVGVGGATILLPAEAAEGDDLTAANVVYVDKDANFFVAGGARYFYDEGDVLTYNDGNVLTFGQFEAALSVGDDIDTSNYSRTFQNDFDIDEDIPGTPTNVQAVAGDFDADANDTSSDDVRVTFTAPTPPNGLIASYNVWYRALPANTACTATFAAGGTMVNTGSTATTFDIEDTLTAGAYCITVQAVSATGDAGTPATATTVTVPAAADTTPPTVSSLTVSDNTVTGTLDANDQVAITFSEPVTLTANASVTFLDADGTVGTLVRGANATMTQNSTGTVVFITLTGSPVLESPGTTLGLDVNPANLDVVQSSGIADVAGNPLAEVSAAVAAPAATDTEFVVTFDEPIDTASVTAADFIVPAGNAVTNIAWSSGNTVATVTVSALAAGDVVGISADSVLNFAGGDGPATNVTATTTV